MAFVVCTKSKNDIKNLIHKVQNYEENTQQTLNLGGRRGRLRSAVSTQKQSTADDSKIKHGAAPVVPTL